MEWRTVSYERIVERWNIWKVDLKILILKLILKSIHSTVVILVIFEGWDDYLKNKPGADINNYSVHKGDPDFSSNLRILAEKHALCFNHKVSSISGKWEQQCWGQTIKLMDLEAATFHSEFRHLAEHLIPALARLNNNASQRN